MEESVKTEQEWTPLSLAQHFHNIYERWATEFGYETRAKTRHFNPETPNGKLMIAVCSEILRDFNAALTAEREKRDRIKIDDGSLGGMKIEWHDEDGRHYAYDKDGKFLWSGEPTYNIWQCVRLSDRLTAERQRREQAERIYTRCPACGNDTLTNNEGHLLCTWHVCPNPTAIENLDKINLRNN